jgi:hypothetical protein
LLALCCQNTGGSVAQKTKEWLFFLGRHLDSLFPQVANLGTRQSSILWFERLFDTV